MRVFSLKKKITVGFIIFCLIASLILGSSLSLLVIYSTQKKEAQIIYRNKKTLQNIYNFESKKLKKISNYYSRAILASLPNPTDNISDVSPWILRNYLLENVPKKWSNYIILILDSKGRVLASALNPNHYGDVLLKRFLKPAYSGQTFATIDKFPTEFLSKEMIKDDFIFYSCTPVFKNHQPLIDAFVIVGYPLNPGSILYRKIAKFVGSEVIRDISYLDSTIDPKVNFIIKNTQDESAIAFPLIMDNSQLNKTYIKIFSSGLILSFLIFYMIIN